MVNQNEARGGLGSKLFATGTRENICLFWEPNFECALICTTADKVQTRPCDTLDAARQHLYTN